MKIVKFLWPLIGVAVVLGCEFDMDGRHRCWNPSDCQSPGRCVDTATDDAVPGYCVLPDTESRESKIDSQTETTQTQTCTNDSDCQVEGQSCEASVCRQRCETVADCGDNALSMVCHGGFCISRCRTQDNCLPKTTCSALPDAENGDWQRSNGEIITGCIYKSICWSDNDCFGAMCGVDFVPESPDGCLPSFCTQNDHCVDGGQCLVDHFSEIKTPYSNSSVSVCSDGSEGAPCLNSVDCESNLICDDLTLPGVCVVF
ncbi:MAG: hypothetical protein JXR76_17480 [Deltaproteobacteria bacterium]|nr:hypothetical protein [Deltaproteobacteria bacterium]